ncbi:MAG: hypothetical protein IJY09_03670 [Lachnospiraceae bacterium]|nr:hypothetical protein [Lachnospiraceae bacterium]
MRNGFKLTKALKIASITYSVLTILFFLFTNLAAGFVAEGKTTGIYQACIILVNVLLYVEMFGYFAIIIMAFLCVFRRGQLGKAPQPVAKEDKFPTIPVIISLVFFLIFMSLMNAILV